MYKILLLYKRGHELKMSQKSFYNFCLAFSYNVLNFILPLQ
jgi:hypothetical protein